MFVFKHKLLTNINSVAPDTFKLQIKFVVDFAMFTIASWLFYACAIMPCAKDESGPKSRNWAGAVYIISNFNTAGQIKVYNVCFFRQEI